MDHRNASKGHEVPAAKAKRQSGSLARQCLHLSHFPWPPGTFLATTASKNWFQSPAGMFRTEEWIRKVRYLLCRTNKVLLPVVGLRREGQGSVPQLQPKQGVAPGPGLRSC